MKSQLAPTDALLKKITNGSARIAIVGLGMVGCMQGRLLAERGFEVDGIDILPERIDACQNLCMPFTCYSDSLEVGPQADVVLVCVRVSPESTALELPCVLREVAESIANTRPAPGLVILITTVPVGTTRALAELLGEKCDDPPLLAFAPERISLNQSLDEVARTPRLVSGATKAAAELAEAVISQICEQVVVVSSPAVAEMSKLLENTFRTTGIALVGEVTRICQDWSISAQEVCDAAATKPFGYFPFFPGPGVGGHCLPNDLELLMHSSSANDIPLLAEVRDSINSLPGHVVRRIEQLLGHVNGKSILLVGVGFKPGAADSTESPAIPIARELLDRNANASYIDCKIERLEVDGKQLERINNLTHGAWDGAILVSGDLTVSIDQLRKVVAGAILDAGGGKIMSGDASGLEQL